MIAKELDQLITKYSQPFTVTNGDDTYVSISKANIKALLSDVVEAVKPEQRKPMLGTPGRNGWNAAIAELEANAKELGLL